MAHIGQTCGCDTADIAHSENRDIHIRSCCIGLAFASYGSLHDMSAKPSYFSRRRVPKGAVVLPTHVIQKRFVVGDRIFRWSCHRIIKAQIIRMNVHQRPSRRSGLSSQAFCTRHRSSAPLSEGRESNPTRGSGIGPHSRAMSSDLSRESRPVLAGIP